MSTTEQKNGGAWEPVVAIGMPTYNRAEYLKAAVDSFLAQTYKRTVVVICDNASSDGTEALGRDYDMRFPGQVKYIRNPKTLTRDGNATFALHRISEVGDLVMMTSDDDLAEPEFVEVCVKALRDDPHAAMAIPNHDTIYYGSERRDEKYMDLHVPDKKDPYGRLKQFILYYSHNERSFCMSGIFRKEIVIGERFEDKTESDVAFALRCLSRGYFLRATDRVLFHKGVIPGIGKESIRTLRFGPAKIRRALQARMRRAASEFDNIGFIAGIKNLTMWERTRLIGWNLTVIVRLFTSANV